MIQQELDDILYLQLIVARLGEKEMMNWWNTDIVFKLGGSAFLHNLLGEIIAPLSAGEAIIEAAKRKEQSLLKDFPSTSVPFSLFVPEPQVQIALKERMRHFKQYPEDLPEKISNILNSRTDFSIQNLKDLILNPEKFEFSDTSFGKKLLKTDRLSVKERLLMLVAGIVSNKKNQYTLYYAEGTHSVVS